MQLHRLLSLTQTIAIHPLGLRPEDFDFFIRISAQALGVRICESSSVKNVTACGSFRNCCLSSACLDPCRCPISCVLGLANRCWFFDHLSKRIVYNEASALSKDGCRATWPCLAWDGCGPPLSSSRSACETNEQSFHPLIFQQKQGSPVTRAFIIDVGLHALGRNAFQSAMTFNAAS